MTKKLIIAGLIILVILMVNSTAKKTDTPSEAKTQPVVTVTEAKPTEIPKEEMEEAMFYFMKANFVDSCVSENSTKKYCECAFEYVTDKYSLSEITEMENMSEEKLMEIMLPAVYACQEYL